MSLFKTAPVSRGTRRESSWALAPRATLAPGRRVVRRLGAGGAHEVFLVETSTHGRAVAKLPMRHLSADPHCLLRLRSEAHALERLAHRTLPLHLDTVLSGPFPHLLLEYVPGPTLDDALAARRQLSPPTVASLGWSLACTLDHIAAAGWVHLDVKPSNIVLNNRPYLLDLELARPANEASRLTRPTGTWAFMPPEQRAAGAADAPPIGPPADVFALAVSLGEALTGRPFLRTLTRRSPRLPGPVGNLLDDALAPSPSERPTAAELAAGLAEHAEARALAVAA